MILEFDGLDVRWEKEIDWECINPPKDNSDEGYDEDVPLAIGAVQQIMNVRVEQWLSAQESSELEGIALGNDFEEDLYAGVYISIHTL